MTAPDIVKNLVTRFEEHRDVYRSGRYNETQLRREFLDRFLEALGWDIFNKQNYSEMYKDVIHEDSLEIEGEKKAPDYAFRVGGTRKFFVEAKKPRRQHRNEYPSCPPVTPLSRPARQQVPFTGCYATRRAT
jgi:predicted type IV restriction endonuclease